MSRRRALAALLLVACGRGAADDARARGATVTVSTVAAETTAAHTPATPGAPCPPTGLWTACAVFQRLDRAGLAPRVDSSGRPAETALTNHGERLHVGASELDLYLYVDASARERDEARLDRAKYVAYDTPLGMQPLPTLIRSANLLAILHSRNDHLRERVADALTAGPPQP